MLVVNNVVVGYGGVPALHGVSCEVNQGEIVAIVGSNGAGKTTLMKTISGLLKPTSGSVMFEGKRTDTLLAHKVALLGIAHVPEGRKLFSRLSVEQNLIVGAISESDRAERAVRMARIFELFPVLKERRTQKAGTLSGGEQQMLAIGRGLMLNPKLLLLDEPSLGLAPKLVDRIFDAIRQISAQGSTVLLVEQNVVEALSMAHRGYVLQSGRMIMQGTGAELLERDEIRQAYLGL